VLENRIDRKTKEIDWLKKEIYRLQGQGQHHNLAQRPHANTIGVGTQVRHVSWN